MPTTSPQGQSQWPVQAPPQTSPSPLTRGPTRRAHGSFSFLPPAPVPDKVPDVSPSLGGCSLEDPGEQSPAAPVLPRPARWVCYRLLLGGSSPFFSLICRPGSCERSRSHCLSPYDGYLHCSLFLVNKTGFSEHLAAVRAQVHVIPVYKPRLETVHSSLASEAAHVSQACGDPPRSRGCAHGGL